VSGRSCAVGGWLLAVGGPWGLSLRAVLKKKKWGFLKDSPAHIPGKGTGTGATNCCWSGSEEPNPAAHRCGMVRIHRNGSDPRGGPRSGYIGGWRRLPKRLGACRFQMPLKLALAVRGTVAGHRLGALEGGVRYLPPFQCIQEVWRSWHKTW
jgi:hypothetical protein